MINILVISGSPVAESSTDFILKHLADEITGKLKPTSEVRTEFVKLNEQTSTFCQACGEAPSSEYCFFDDDLTMVYQHLERADCLLFGSPIYFDSVSAQAKMFIDRCNCFRPADFNNTDPEHDFIKRIPRKRPGAIILVGSEHGWLEGARRVVAGFFKWVEVVNEGVLIHKSSDFHLKGTARDDRQLLSETAALGQKLAQRIVAGYD